MFLLILDPPEYSLEDHMYYIRIYLSLVNRAKLQTHGELNIKFLDL